MPRLRVRQLTKKGEGATKPENFCKSIIYKLLCAESGESQATVGSQAIW